MKRCDGQVAGRWPRYDRGWSADLGQHEAFAFRFRNGIAEFFRGINPQSDSFVGFCERRLGKAADLDDEFVLPINSGAAVPVIPLLI